MKQGITVTASYDYHDNTIVVVKKRRGKLTFAEVEEALRYGDGNRWCNHYALLLNCSEATVEGSGYFDEDEPQGDEVVLYPIEEGEFCPVCGELTPPFNYCPTCGTSWKDCNVNVETLLDGMKAETVCEIQRSSSYASKVAWYWSHVGALDMAGQLGLITEERRQQLSDELKQFKPAPEGGEPNA